MRALRYFANNRLTILQNGEAYFPALLRAINASRTEIYFETYIFSNDETGQVVIEALKGAARRGVEVHVITDWWGTGQLMCEWLAREFRQDGVAYRVFNPWFRRGIARTHRKICVVDRKIGFVGGINVTNDWQDDYLADFPLPAPRWDIAVRVEGPLVTRIHHEIEVQWVRQAKMSLMARFWLMYEKRLPPQRIVGQRGLAGFVVRDNLHHRRTIQRAYSRAIGLARKNIIMANPYFAPCRKFRRALAVAASRGVEVTLLLGVGEFRFQDSVAQSFYPKLLRDGVKLYEYRKTQLHGKVAVVDDVWATIGSSNFDGLSLFLNHEANVLVKERDFATELRERIESAIQDATPIHLEDFANRPWHKRAWYGMAYFLYRCAMRIVTLGDYT